MRQFHSCWLLFALLFLVTSSCSVRMPVSSQAIPRNAIKLEQMGKRPSKQDTVGLYLMSDSLHTTLAIPYDWLLESGYKAPAKVTFNKGAPRYVVMSWGDRTAYTQKRWLDPFQVFHALFMPSPSVTEFIPIAGKIEQICSQHDIYKAEIPRSHGKHLVAFLMETTKYTPQNQPQIIGPSSWGDGYLFEGNFSYFFPRVCNVWTAQCMEACGLKMNISRSIFASSIVDQCVEQGFVKVNDGQD